MAHHPQLSAEAIETVTGLGLPAPTAEGVARMRERMAAAQREIDSGKYDPIWAEVRASAAAKQHAA